MPGFVNCCQSDIVTCGYCDEGVIRTGYCILLVGIVKTEPFDIVRKWPASTMHNPIKISPPTTELVILC